MLNKLLVGLLVCGGLIAVSQTITYTPIITSTPAETLDADKIDIATDWLSGGLDGSIGAVATVNSGTAAFSTSINTFDGYPGIVTLATSTSASAAPVLNIIANDSIQFGSGGTYLNEWVIFPTSTAPDATQLYQYRIGFTDSTSSTWPTDCAMFMYATNSTNWLTVTGSNGTYTTNTSTATVSGWVKLGILVNAAADAVYFYANGVPVSTNTTNIPKGDDRNVGAGAQIVKLNGTTSRSLFIDAARIKWEGAARW